MRLDYRASPFVIIGGWNPHIINEHWIRKNLLDHPNEQVRINISGGISPTGIPQAITEALFSNVRLAILGERLELNLINGNDFTHVEDYVRKLCNCQSNTLVSGYGLNFVYTDNRVDDNLRSIVGRSNITQEIITENHAYTINLGGIIATINVDVNNSSNQSGLRFNFHFNIDALSTLIQGMTQYPITSLNEKAVEFASSQYGLRLEN